MNLPNKSSILYPIPITLLKQCVNELIPYITFLINLSLNTGELCIYHKTAAVIPVLKKDSLESVLNSYRPISNLPIYFEQDNGEGGLRTAILCIF